MMNKRLRWTRTLKEQLHKSQDRMKKFADKKRLERHFKVGDLVYVKLQPYRQVTVQGRNNAKLSPRYYGPFEITAKLGTVAYELNLPPGTQIHPVFHVSQLKGKVGDGQTVSPVFPLTYPSQNSKEELEGILGRRMIKRKNEVVPQILIKWLNQDVEEASWEDYEDIKRRFPAFILRDKDRFEREGMSESEQLRLLAVEKFDSVNCERKEETKPRSVGQTVLTPTLSLLSRPQETGSLIEGFGQQGIEPLTKRLAGRDINFINDVSGSLEIGTAEARE